MTTKTTNKFSPEVRARAVRLVFDQEAKHQSRWAAISSIAGKIGCSAHTLHEWVKKAEVDTGQAACWILQNECCSAAQPCQNCQYAQKSTSTGRSSGGCRLKQVDLPLFCQALEQSKIIWRHTF